MDATENATKSVVGVEYIVNGWVVDYYYCLALELLKRKQYEDFRNICSTVESILNRPIEDLNNLSLKIRLLQFLSRLNEAENPEKQFETDRTSTPLESAQVLLEQITGEFRIPKQIGDDASVSLREFIVGTFIKNKQFDKAKDALLKHLTKSVSSKRETFMKLISQKSKAHEVINQINVQCLMQEMLDFCQKVCPFTLPFMCKTARSLIEKRPEEAVISTGEQDQSTSSCSPQINIFNLQFCEHSVIQKARLEVAYNALAGGSTQMTFVQLEEEIKQETQEKEEACLQLSAEAMRSTNLSSEQEAGLQRETRSPREASPADQPPLLDTDRQTPSGSLSGYTVSRLVIGPDSQQNSQSTTHSEEPRIEIPPQTLTSKDSNDMQCPVTDAEIPFPARKRLRKSSCLSHTMTENSSDCNEESCDPDEEKKSNVDDDDHRSSRSSSRDDSKSKRSSSEVEDGPQVSLTPSRTSQKTPSKPLARCSPANDPGEVEDISIVDSSLDSSSSVSSHPSLPQSSTPQRGRHKVPLDLGWKQLAKEAKESKETWSDEELCFTSTRSTAAGSGSNKSTISKCGTRKRAWTESETEKLKEGVKKFGVGSWSKIKSFYSFDRSNVNLKDRWRTLKKSNLV